MKASPTKANFFMAIENALILLLGKFIVPNSSWHIIAFVVAFLWYKMINGKKWAMLALKFSLLLGIAFGILGLFLFFAYTYRKISPIPCIYMVCVGINCFISWLVLRKKLQVK